MEYLLQQLQTQNGQLHLSCSSANQVPATARTLTEVEVTGCHRAFDAFFPLPLALAQFLPHFLRLQNTLLAVTANTDKRTCHTINWYKLMYSFSQLSFLNICKMNKINPKSDQMLISIWYYLQSLYVNPQRKLQTRLTYHAQVSTCQLPSVHSQLR